MALSLLGATGSIGRQTLYVAERLGYPVCALAAGKRAGELEAAVRRFRPKLAALYDESAAADLDVPDIDHGIVRMETPVAALESIADAAHALDYVKTGDQVGVDLSRVADQPQHGLV